MCLLNIDVSKKLTCDEQVVTEMQEIHEEHMIVRFDFPKRLGTP
jgi:hypothetical protein